MIDFKEYQINKRQCKDCVSYSFCQKYEKDNKNKVDKNRVWVGVMSPIRKCQHAIADEYYTKIKNSKVLEVGCGNSRKGSFIKEIIEKDNKWIGIDIVESDITTCVCDVINMPFVDASFDVVIGNQTMEHWKEPAKALKEIYRVLKKDGQLFLNVPVHLHGEKMFVEGNYFNIIDLFADYKIKIETWREDRNDLQQYLPKEASDNCAKIGCWKVDNSVYILNIIAKKNEDILKQETLQ